MSKNNQPDALPLAPPVSVQEMQRLAATELSLRSRLGYTALLLSALAVSGVIGALWLTEPSLPMRTQIAFALMIGIGLSWVVFSTWVLTRRRVLLAVHSLVAARMAVSFSALFVVSFLALGYWGPSARAPYAAAAFGLVLLAVALGLQGRARRRFEQLTNRRRALEHEIAKGPNELPLSASSQSHSASAQF